MVFRRLPTYLPNFPLTLLPLNEAKQKLYEQTGFLKELAFRTLPRVNKLEIKRFLESAYGLQIERVDTINYEGKKKRVTGKGATFPGKSRTTGIFVRRPSFKKAYVTLKDPPPTSNSSTSD